MLNISRPRFCQWKNLELNINLSMNDFSVHRIIGRGGFGEVYGCRKADTGKMYAMKARRLLSTACRVTQLIISVSRQETH